MQTMPNIIINENTRSFSQKDLTTFMGCESKAQDFIHAYRGACKPFFNMGELHFKINCLDLDTLATNFKNGTFSG